MDDIVSIVDNPADVLTALGMDPTLWDAITTVSYDERKQQDPNDESMHISDAYIADVDWDEVAAAGWTLDEFENDVNKDPIVIARDTENDTLDDDSPSKQKKRRLSEVERLRKFSWVIHELPAVGKRARYTYVNANGATASSMRQALRECRKM